MKAIEKKKKKFWHNINKVVASRKVSSFLPSLARLFEDLANTPMEKEGPSGSPGIGNAEKKKKKKKMDMNMNMRKKHAPATNRTRQR